MEPFHLENPSYLTIKEWEKNSPNLRAGITTRFGGSSPSPFESLNLGFHVKDNLELVSKNRNTLASLLDFPLDNWVLGEQIHHSNVAVISKEDAGRGAYNQESVIKGLDGFMTNNTGILCAALFADCVPLFFYDPLTGWIGIAHAGWKGTVNQIAREMIMTFKKNGVSLKDLQVVIGPSISCDKYEVDEKVFQAIPHQFQNEVTIPSKRNAHFWLDLKALNARILMDVGVPHEDISISEYCTFQNDLFFSHRRENGRTGRMLGFIGFQEKT